MLRHFGALTTQGHYRKLIFYLVNLAAPIILVNTFLTKLISRPVWVSTVSDSGDVFAVYQMGFAFICIILPPRFIIFTAYHEPRFMYYFYDLRKREFRGGMICPWPVIYRKRESLSRLLSATIFCDPTGIVGPPSLYSLVGGCSSHPLQVRSAVVPRRGSIC
jgi:hypothetical protein